MVSDYVVDTENATIVRDWIDICKQVFRDLNNMIVVFMINNDEFLKFGRTNA